MTFGTLSINFRVNAKPNVPASLTQVNASSAAIANNGITNDTTVTLGGTLSDPDAGDTVLLQLEVRPSTVAFSDSATSSTSLGAQGVQTKAVTPGYGTWHWQARTVDQYGAASAWVAGYTFRINTPPSSPAALAQRDGTGTMAVGALTNDTSITFRAAVNDLDNSTNRFDRHHRHQGRSQARRDELRWDRARFEPSCGRGSNGIGDRPGSRPGDVVSLACRGNRQSTAP